MSSEEKESTLRLVRLKRELARKEAKEGSFIHYCKYIDGSYSSQWFHKYLAKKLETFLKDDTKKCMAICMPPQHGKSQEATKLFPSFALGQNPNLKIAVCAYNSPFSSSFNRAIQRYIDSKEYKEIFPDTTINSKNVVTVQSWLRNSDEFEIVDKKGSLKSVGVGGGLSGHPVDLGIIDDPIKDYKEASSDIVKEAIWNWYLSVFCTRLHNHSKQIIIMTRWAEDDLIGRLTDPEVNPNYEDWDVVKIEAIKEHTDIPEDPREIGEALWEEKHSLDKLLKLKALDESIFNCLYQQEPNTKEGTTIKRDWFQIVDSYPEYLTKDLWVDTSDTEKKSNDPNGFLTTCFDENTSTLYIVGAESEHLETPGRLKKINILASRHNLGHDSLVKIEPKSSGRATKQMINRMKDSNLTAIDIESYLVGQSKASKHGVSATYIQSGKLKLVRGGGGIRRILIKW